MTLSVHLRTENPAHSYSLLTTGRPCVVFPLMKPWSSTRGLGACGFCAVSQLFLGLRFSGQRSQTLFPDPSGATLPALWHPAVKMLLLWTATSITTGFFCCLSTATMSGWLGILSVWTWKSHRVLAWSFSTTFRVVCQRSLSIHDGSSFYSSSSYSCLRYSLSDVLLHVSHLYII